MAALERWKGSGLLELGGILKEKFPEVSAQQIGKVVSQFERFEPIQESFMAGPLAGRLRRQDIPRDPALPEAYRYGVKLVFKNQGGAIVSAFDVIVDSSRNLTKGELQELAYRRGLELQSTGAYERAWAKQKWTKAEVELVLTTRKT